MPVQGPDSESLLQCWWRLCTAPEAAEAFAWDVLPPLIASLNGRQPEVLEHDLITTAEDAVLALIKRPAKYDPTKYLLNRFLLTASDQFLADGDEHAALPDGGLGQGVGGELADGFEFGEAEGVVAVGLTHSVR